MLEALLVIFFVKLSFRSDSDESYASEERLEMYVEVLEFLFTSGRGLNV